MKSNRSVLMILILFAMVLVAVAGDQFESDTVETKSGDIVMTFIGHGTLMFKFGDQVVHVDPVSRYADYAKMPTADIILVTHHHGDHLSPETIEKIRTDRTVVICNTSSAADLKGEDVLKNGEVKKVGNITVKAVPAYNIIHKRENGEPFHPRGTGNGYVISFGGKKIYVAGDTENVPEMKKLKNIDFAFLPMNLPYTMTPEMVADAVGMFHPKVLYPYHYGNSDVDHLLELLKDQKETEIRVRNLK